MTKHVAITLASGQALVAGGKKWGEAWEGFTQGDPEAGAEFDVSWQEEIVELNRRFLPTGGQGLFGNDDGYILGLPEVLFQQSAGEV